MHARQSFDAEKQTGSWRSPRTPPPPSRLKRPALESFAQRLTNQDDRAQHRPTPFPILSGARRGGETSLRFMPTESALGTVWRRSLHGLHNQSLSTPGVLAPKRTVSISMDMRRTIAGPRGVPHQYSQACSVRQPAWPDAGGCCEKSGVMQGPLSRQKPPNATRATTRPRLRGKALMQLHRALRTLTGMKKQRGGRLLQIATNRTSKLRGC